MSQPSMSRDLALSCQGVHRYLGSGEGRVHVLRGVGFEAERGKVCAIVGPSGCGKSTLLYLLGLLDRAEAGDIWINGNQMSHADDIARTAVRGEHVGFVFQFHFLLPEFTALENVMMPMRKLGRLSADHMVARAQQLLADVGLGDKSKRLATQLSGGEQQRVALARALVNNPKLLLADEPTGDLDEITAGRVFDLISRLHQSHGLTSILVTHNLELAGRCTRALRLESGKLTTMAAAS